MCAPVHVAAPIYVALLLVRGPLILNADISVSSAAYRRITRWRTRYPLPQQLEKKAGQGRYTLL
jgi:hypothetical protein